MGHLYNSVFPLKKNNLTLFFKVMKNQYIFKIIPASWPTSTAFAL
jgi:hypothetical protein